MEKISLWRRIRSWFRNDGIYYEGMQPIQSDWSNPKEFWFDILVIGGCLAFSVVVMLIYGGAIKFH
jgi:hypothetical protein